MSNAMREAFERQFPKPQGVIFDERRRFYISGLDGENGVTKHNARWQGWQAALEHAGRNGDKSGAWQFFKDGEWHVGINQFNHRGNTEAAGYPVRDLYTHPPAPVMPEGVTEPNWKEHDGGAMPTELLNQPCVLVQFDNGALSFRARSADDWFDVVDCPTVARYTVIDTERATPESDQ